MGAGRPITRRDLIKRGGVLAGTGLALPILAACAPKKPAPAAASSASAASQSPQSIEGAKIKVSTYGGFFEDNFKKMYPGFTDATGVEVESLPEPTSEVWVVQLQNAVEAGTPPPADVSMLSGVGVQRAINGGILATYDLSAIPNNEFLAEGYIRTDESGAVAGVGAVSWYITLVSEHGSRSPRARTRGRPSGTRSGTTSSHC